MAATSVTIPATQAQNFLIGHGFDTGAASADGVFGPLSEHALQNALMQAGQVSTSYTVATDKHSVALPVAVWSALATLPTRPPVRRGTSSRPASAPPPVTSSPTDDSSSAPADGGGFGAYVPWLIGGVIALGGYLFYRGRRR
jgi:hypothetical protein